MDQGDVELYQGRLSTLPLASLLACLSTAERQRADGYRRFVDYSAWVKGRGMLRCILAQRTGQLPQRIRLTETDGKPALADNPSVWFSVSRSDDMLAVAVAASPIGVDIERMRADFDWQPIASQIFHRTELAALRHCSLCKQTRLFYSIWTQKEAFAKAVGRGFALPFEQFSVAPKGGQVLVEPPLRAEAPWYGTVVDTMPGYRLSLVSYFRAPCVRAVSAP